MKFLKWVNVYDRELEEKENFKVQCPFCGHENVFAEGQAQEWCEHLDEDDYMTAEKGQFGNYTSIYFAIKIDEEDFEDFIENCDITHWKYMNYNGFIWRKHIYAIDEITPSQLTDLSEIFFSEDPETIAEHIAKTHNVTNDEAIEFIKREVEAAQDREDIVGLIDWGLPVFLTTPLATVYAVVQEVEYGHNGIQLFNSFEKAKKFIEELIEDEIKRN